EVEFILRFTEASALILPRQFRRFDYLDMLGRLRPNLPHLRYVLVVGDDVTAEYFDLRRFLDAPGGPPLDREFSVDVGRKATTWHAPPSPRARPAIQRRYCICTTRPIVPPASSTRDTASARTAYCSRFCRSGSIGGCSMYCRRSSPAARWYCRRYS